MTNKALEKLTAQIQKTYGNELVSFASDKTDRDITVHSTGSLMLDLAIGGSERAGIPEGRIMEVYGPESQGKTTLCLLMIAARQREEDMKEEEDSNYQKKYCIFVDAEHALDFKLAEEYGVNLNELIYINPETAEQAMDVLDAYIRSGQIGLAVVDSVPAMLPSSVEQSSFEQQHMAVLARFMSGVMQKITGPVFKNKVTLIFINQVREAIGKFSPVGTPEVTPGGRALKYYASVRMSVRRGDLIKEAGEQIGHSMKIRLVKNKISVPYKEANINLVYGKGIDRADELFQVAKKSGLIKQAGAWYTYIDEETGEIIAYNGAEMRTQGKETMIEHIRNIPQFFGDLENKIRGIQIEADDMDEKEIAAIRDNKD